MEMIKPKSIMLKIICLIILPKLKILLNIFPYHHLLVIPLLFHFVNDNNVNNAHGNYIMYTTSIGN